MPQGYQETIHAINQVINPAGVESCMRLEYGTLDHLGHDTFVEETELAKRLEEEEPRFLRSTAALYGLQKDFDSWETRLKAADAG